MLRALFVKGIEYIDSKRCDTIPKPMQKVAVRAFEVTMNDFVGETIIPKDEVCEQLGCGMTHLANEVKKGKLPPPEPLHEVRVGIRQKHIDNYIDTHI